MTIELDHTIVPARNKAASANVLADLLGVQWAPTGAGPFAPVYDHKVDPQYGNVYWNVPDGHQWEMLVLSYARP